MMMVVASSIVEAKNYNKWIEGGHVLTSQFFISLLAHY